MSGDAKALEPVAVPVRVEHKNVPLADTGDFEGRSRLLADDGEVLAEWWNDEDFMAERLAGLINRGLAAAVSDVVAVAVAEALVASKLPADVIELGAPHWHGMYIAQCEATDRFAAQALAKSDQKLRERIDELEELCASLNRRIVEMNEGSR